MFAYSLHALMQRMADMEAEYESGGADAGGIRLTKQQQTKFDGLMAEARQETVSLVRFSSFPCDTFCNHACLLGITMFI